jgi:hypothetical protein
LKKAKTTPQARKLQALQNRIDRIQELSDFLNKHPALAAISTLKPTYGGLVGLVIDEKAFVRPQGVNKPGMRMERWLEDTIADMESQDRLVCEEVTGLSTEELEKLLATIPARYEADDLEGDEEDEE